MAKELAGVRSGDGGSLFDYLPSERPLIRFRWHWRVVALQLFVSEMLLGVGAIVARFFWGNRAIVAGAIFFCIVVVARCGWKVSGWYRESVLCTDKRFILISGILHQSITVMDMENRIVGVVCEQSKVGSLLGYGKIIVETEGEDDPLTVLDYVPGPEVVYKVMSELQLYQAQQLSGPGDDPTRSSGPRGLG